MADIFVSYSSEDRARIKPLIDAIAAEGLSVWWDRRIGMGSSFDREIERELDSARCVVVVWSEKSVDSDWVRNEAQEGYERGILVPVRIDDIRPPLAYRRTQTADLIGWPVLEAEFGPFLDSIFNHVATGTTRPQPAQTTLPVANAIAVLPFANMSNDPEQEFFSDGICEDILNELAKSELTVRPRSSSFALKGEPLDIQTIGSRLNVTHVLEGSVRRAGDRIRVTVQLSEVDANRSIWSERYDRVLRDIFMVQDEITAEILHALNAQLRESRAPRKFAGMEAYNAFLRGRHHLGRLELKPALEWLEKAITLDDLNPDAWATRARVLDIQGPNEGQSLQAHRDQIAGYFDHVLSIDPANPHALAWKAQKKFYRDRDYQASINQLISLVKANPNHEEAHRHLGWVLAAIGRTELFLRVARRTVEISPLSSEAMTSEIAGLLMAGQQDEARLAFEGFSQLGIKEDPQLAAWFAILDNDADTLQALVSEGGWGSSFTRKWHSALVAYLRGEFTHVGKIIAPFQRTDRYQSFWQKHLIALIQRDFDEAFDYYAKALDSGAFFAFYRAHLNFVFRHLFPEFFEDPRYNRILQEFDLNTASTAKISVLELPF